MRSMWEGVSLKYSRQRKDLNLIDGVVELVGGVERCGAVEASVFVGGDRSWWMVIGGGLMCGK